MTTIFIFTVAGTYALAAAFLAWSHVWTVEQSGMVGTAVLGLLAFMEV